MSKRHASAPARRSSAIPAAAPATLQRSAQPDVAVMPDGLTNRILAAMVDVPVDFGGGCGFFKGLLMAALIVGNDMQLAVEIGVYRGRSLVPQALAFQAKGSGRVVGVDPYSAVEALQTDDHEIPREILGGFTDAADWEGLYMSTLNRVIGLGLRDQCELRRMTSHAAAESFGDGTIDMLHVDGNHDLAPVLDDLKSYLPKMKRGGYLIMDDASWRAIKPAMDMLDESLQGVLRLDDRGLFEMANRMDFAVYRLP
jgi:hypothetical protein